MKVAIFSLFAVLMSVGILTGQPSQEGKYRVLTPSETRALLLENPDAFFIDVRTPEEFAFSRIPGSTLIPDYELLARAPQVFPAKDSLIVLYCRSGNRSRTAALQLIRNGYTNVYDAGGIISWPYEVER